MRLICIFFIIVLTGCSSTPSRTTEIFSNPSSYVGKDTTVCGLLNHGAIVDSGEYTSDVYSVNGLSIIDGRALKSKKQKEVCITGEIVYLGCRSDPEVVCTDDWYYDYAVKISSKEAIP